MNKLIFIIIIISFFSLNIFAQSGSGSVIKLANELYLITFTESIKNSSIRSEDKTSFETTNKNSITRNLAIYSKNKLYSYELEVEKTEEVDKYKLTMKPPSEEYKTKLKSKLTQYPNLEILSVLEKPISKIVSDGDLITIDILEIPETKEKITDYVKILKDKKPFGNNYFPERNKSVAKDFSLEDVELKLSKFDIYINGKLVQKIGGGAAGSIVWINFPDGKAKGRFVFSIIPREGYDFQKTGNIKDYTIEFNFNGDNYQIVSSVPIISTSKNWNLWILHQPDYKPQTFTGYVIGATDGVKGLSN